MHIRTRISQALAAVLLLLGVSTLRAEDRTITKGDTIVVTAGQVEVRAEDKTIATVSKGQRFKVIAVSGNWLGIEVRGETGWIAREDAAPAAMPRAAAPRAQGAGKGKTGLPEMGPAHRLRRLRRHPQAEIRRGGRTRPGSELTASGFPKDQVYLMDGKAEDNRYRPFRENIERELDQVLGLPRRGDLVVVAFCGHGVEVGGKDCWCPLDAQLKRLKETTIAVAGVYDRMQRSKASLKLLIVDACRNDMVPETQRGVVPAQLGSYGAAKDPPPEGIMLLRSCGTGQTSQEDPDLGHGVFMHFLLEGMQGKAANEEGAVSLLRLADYASLKTKEYVHDKLSDYQTPALDGHIDGPFELCPAGQGGEIVNSLGMKLVLIPAGQFTMGSEESAEETARYFNEKYSWDLKAELFQRRTSGASRANQPAFLSGRNARHPRPVPPIRERGRLPHRRGKGRRGRIRNRQRGPLGAKVRVLLAQSKLRTDRRASGRERQLERRNGVLQVAQR